MPEPRTLRFDHLGEVMPEVDRLLRGGYEPAGRWTLGQACSHLTGALLASIEGVPFRAPWFVRALVGGLAKRSVLGRRQMPRGTPLPAKFAPRPDLDDRAEAEALRAALGIFGRHAGPVSIHPLFGPMTKEEWTRFHAIHSAHHLGFLVPPVAENPAR